MAITIINNGTIPQKGITYSVITDTSADWGGVTNDTYFYNLDDDLPYYKNASGDVIGVFEEGGGISTTGGTYSVPTLTLNQSDGSTVDITGVTGQNIYNSDDVLTSNRVVTLDNKSLDFSGGLVSVQGGGSSVYAPVFKIKNYGTSEVYTFGGNGNISIDRKLSISTNNNSVDFLSSDINILESTNSINLISNIYPRMQLGSANGNWWIASTESSALAGNGDFIINNRSGTGNAFLVKPTGQVLLHSGSGREILANEDISLQASTLISDEFVQHVSTTPTVDGNLIDNSLSFHIDGSDTLAGRYKNNLGVVTDLKFPVPSGLIEVIRDGDSGVPTYFSDLQTALETCKTLGSNNTIKLHSNIVITSQIDINTNGVGIGNGYGFKSLTIDGNGFEIIFNDLTTADAIRMTLSHVCDIDFKNTKVLRTSGAGAHYALNIDGSGQQKLKMSNCYFYSDNGGAAFIRDIIGEMMSLGNSKFESDSSFDTLTFRSFNMFFRDFSAISNGIGTAVRNYSDGEITNFYCENTSTGKAYEGETSSVASYFVAKSNSGICVESHSSLNYCSNFKAISTNGLCFQGRKADFFFLKTGNSRALDALSYAKLTNGYVENDSASSTMTTNTINVCDNVYFVNKGSGYSADLDNTVAYNNKITNCTFTSELGIGAFLDIQGVNVYNSTFISRYNNANGHACELNVSDCVLLDCTFIVENSSANGIYSNSALTAKVGNCSFDNSTTPINANVTITPSTDLGNGNRQV